MVRPGRCRSIGSDVARRCESRRPRLAKPCADLVGPACASLATRSRASLQGRADRAGRDADRLDIGDSLLRAIAVDRDIAARREDLGRVLFPVLPPALLARHGIDPDDLAPVKAAFAPGDIERAFALTPDDVADRIMVAGTPEDWIEWFSEAYAGAGLTMRCSPSPTRSRSKRGRTARWRVYPISSNRYDSSANTFYRSFPDGSTAGGVARWAPLSHRGKGSSDGPTAPIHAQRQPSRLRRMALASMGKRHSACERAALLQLVHLSSADRLGRAPASASKEQRGERRRIYSARCAASSQAEDPRPCMNRSVCQAPPSSAVAPPAARPRRARRSATRPSRYVAAGPSRARGPGSRSWRPLGHR